MESASLQEQALAQWRRFIEGQPLEGPLSSVILESWERSRAAGVDPDPDRPRFHHVTEAELQERIEANADLLAAAIPHLKWLAGAMAQLPYGLHLVDRDGIILYSLGHPSERWQDFGFLPGYDWSERAMGTNGAGTALAANQPVAIIGGEHYSRSWHGFACTAAPIHAPDGRVIGAIDIRTPLTEGNPERLVVAAHLAYSIEQELSDRKALSPSTPFPLFLPDSSVRVPFMA